MQLLTLAGVLVVAIVGIQQAYDNSPRDFILKIDPNSEIHICIVDGQIIFDQSTEVAPNVHKIEPGSVSFNHGIMEYSANISVANVGGPWWALWQVVKPYKDRVTLIAQNVPPGMDIAFADASFSAEVQDTSNITGIPPFESNIILKFAANTTLAYGPHYIIIKGVGQDGTERTCTCVLKVSQSCGPNRYVSVGNISTLSNAHIYISNNSFGE
jgi:hypothetical protein